MCYYIKRVTVPIRNSYFLKYLCFSTVIDQQLIANDIHVYRIIVGNKVVRCVGSNCKG